MLQRSENVPSGAVRAYLIPGKFPKAGVSNGATYKVFDVVLSISWEIWYWGGGSNRGIRSQDFVGVIDWWVETERMLRWTQLHPLISDAKYGL